MKRADVVKGLRTIAKQHGAELTLDESGGRHTIVRFNGVKVTTRPRHREINEFTAQGILDTAASWTGDAS